jgi:hypothetical protein
MVRRWSENDITKKKQTENIQKGETNRVSGGRNHYHAVIITWCLIFYLAKIRLPTRLFP